MRVFLQTAVVLIIFLITGCQKDVDLQFADLEKDGPATIPYNKAENTAKIIATSSSYLNIHLETSGIIQWGEFEGSHISVTWDAKFPKSTWVMGRRWAVSGNLTINIEGQKPIQLTRVPPNTCVQGWYLYTNHEGNEEHLDYDFRGTGACIGINRPIQLGIFGHQSVKKGGIEQVQVYMRPSDDTDPDHSIFSFTGVPSEFRVY